MLLINETMARTLFPGENPIGQMIEYVRIDGLSASWAMCGISRRRPAGEWRCTCRFGRHAMGGGGPRCSYDIAASDARLDLCGVLWPIQPNLATNDFRTLQQLVDKAVSPRRFLVLLLGGFALFALVLASLGIYGVISYSVSQRAQEMEFGWLWRVRRRGAKADLRQTLGSPLEWCLGQERRGRGEGLSGLLFGVTATDPATFGGCWRC